MSSGVKHISQLFFIAFLISMLSCTVPEQTTQVQFQVIEPDNRYDSEFPIKSVSKELDYISNRVKKLDCLAFYKSYIFSPDNQIVEENLTEEVLEEYSIGNTVTNQSVSGTAIVVYYDGSWIGMITNAHVVDFPDTIITRYDNGLGPIEVVAVKIKQQNFIKDLPDGDPIEILAKDQKNDIALLGRWLEEHGGLLPVLDLPIGNTKDLDWGSIVYTLGYPVGHLMVTRAIVSNPERAKKGRFLTDALYNRGISGSPVFAIRDGAPNLELVGMATSASARNVYYVKPGKESPEFINPDFPFTGEMYVDQYKDIKYGVTFNVSIEAIIDFLNKNSNQLSQIGFNTDRFFK